MRRLQWNRPEQRNGGGELKVIVDASDATLFLSERKEALLAGKTYSVGSSGVFNKLLRKAARLALEARGVDFGNARSLSGDVGAMVAAARRDGESWQSLSGRFDLSHQRLKSAYVDWFEAQQPPAAESAEGEA